MFKINHVNAVMSSLLNLKKCLLVWSSVTLLLTSAPCGREFPAHKVKKQSLFAAMFEHPTKEKLSNQVNVEDIDPDVFNELRFIYTGQVPSDNME